MCFGILFGGTDFLAISGILVFAIVFTLEARLLWFILCWHNSFLYGLYLQGVLIHGLGFLLYVAFNRS